MPDRPMEFPELVSELGSLVERLRIALRAALDEVVPDLGGARACGRALGLKRGLGWKVYSLATASDLQTALKVLPQRDGWKQILARLEELQCPPAELDSLREAVAAAASRLDAAKIGRPLLRAVAAGGLDTARETAAMLQARRSMREGAEELYGIRTDAKIGTFVVGRPDRKGLVDLAGILQYEGLRRLRPGPPFPLHHSPLAWNPRWKELKRARPFGASPDQGSLVPDLSSVDPSRHQIAVRIDDGRPNSYLFDESVSTAGGVRAVFADLLRKAGNVGHADDRVDLDVAISMPTVRAVLEVWIHASITLVTEPAAALVGSFGRGFQLEEATDTLRLSLEATATPIAAPTLSGPLRRASPAHVAVVDRAIALLGGDRGDYVGYRVIVPDPPIGSRVMLKWRM